MINNIRTVGAMLASKEGEIVRYSIEELLKYCDEVVVVLDNYNDETAFIVTEYVINTNGKVRAALSKVKGDNRVAKARLNAKQGEIREQVLIELKKLYNKKHFDLLLWIDADEIFTKEFPIELEKFWNSDKRVMFLGTITPFDGFNIVKERGIFPHAKIFKYTPEMTAIPYRHRSFHHPFKREECVRVPLQLIHLALLNNDIREYRKAYIGSERLSDDKLWILDKDVREMSFKELKQCRRRQNDTTIYEYSTSNTGI